MIVHLAASLRDPDTDGEYLYKIIEVVHDHGGVMSHNWLEPAIARNKEDVHIPDWRPYVEANLEGIKRSDVVIVDITHYSFSQGFMVAAALEYKKPILAVSRDTIDGKMAIGIANPLFQYKKYTSAEELSHIVKSFLVKNTIHTKDLRFNMFLTRTIYKYLDEVSRETGKNKSEIIREVIKQKAQE